MGNVKIYRHTDYGAPQLYGNAGFLITVLDACLVNGYGSQTVLTMTHTNNIVSVTTPVPHNLQPYSRQTIEGANEAGYNGEFVIQMLDAFSFYYTTSGISVSPATGTITTKSAGAGWSKPFSGTNLAAYRPGAGPRHFLRIDDTADQNARCIGYEDMTAISTGTGPFPTAAQVTGGLYWQKSNVADATSAREWIIVADDKTMYMWTRYTTTNTYDAFAAEGMGDYSSYKDGDVYNSFISANTNNGSYQYMYFSYLNSYPGAVLIGSVFGFYGARSYTQIGSSAVLGKIGEYSKAAQGGMGAQGVGLPYPHPVDGGLYMCPITIAEGVGVAAQSVVRGIMRGVWNPLHSIPLNHGDIFNGNGDLAGKTFITCNACHATSSLGQFMLDISLTWD